MSFLLPAAAAGIGGLLGGLGGKSKKKKVSRFTPQQQKFFDLLGQALGGGGGPFADIAAPFDEPAAAERFQQRVGVPALEQFREQIVPQITGQFRGKGLGESSFLGQALGREGERLQERLASQLGEELFRGREAGTARRLQALGGLLGTQQFDLQPQTSTFDRILGGAGAGLGAISPFFRPTA